MKFYMAKCKKNGEADTDSIFMYSGGLKLCTVLFSKPHDEDRWSPEYHTCYCSLRDWRDNWTLKEVKTFKMTEVM